MSRCHECSDQKPFSALKKPSEFFRTVIEAGKYYFLHSLPSRKKADRKKEEAEIITHVLELLPHKP
jgi:hypothetical protein